MVEGSIEMQHIAITNLYNTVSLITRQPLRDKLSAEMDVKVSDRV